ncbi:MAG: DegT/DnrJ/EryC1/StrS family aminotransferase [Planctomycetaceae bacterium]|jgi:dTDP-4-amino-4,6-dideoxygalactose transaminase|nr:DegT/DnrJ/EryC1/StrS family aminotransferase [Planctomycetaceae bacterium]
MQISFSKVDCSGREIEYVTRVIQSGWLTTANICSEFEKKFTEFIGVKYALAVNSCTAALHLAADAIGIKPGDKIFVPIMTFTASAEIIRYLNADPVFLDVDYGTALLTPEILETGIKQHPEVKAVVLVHYAGQSVNMSEILPICSRHHIKIIEDAAHAFPTKHKGQFIGTFGNITCFSFYANKTITTGEGGMIVTENEDIYKRMKCMRLHGINRDIWDRFTTSGKWEYDVIAPGFKYNMPDINAAIGLAQIERAEKFRSERERCARHYFKEFKELQELDLPEIQCDWHEHSWHLFPIVLTEKSRVNRNEFIKQLNERGIGVSVHYKPLHRMTYYRTQYNLLPEDFPNAERRWQGGISLPIFPLMTNEELNYVTSSIKDILLNK